MRRITPLIITAAALSFTLSGCSTEETSTPPEVEVTTAAPATEPSAEASDDHAVDESITRADPYFSREIPAEMVVEDVNALNTEFSIQGWDMALTNAGFVDSMPHMTTNADAIELYPEVYPAVGQKFFIYKVTNVERGGSSQSLMKIHLTFNGAEKTRETTFPAYDYNLAEIISVPEDTESVKIDFILDDEVQSFNALTGERL